ncbi:MAG: class I SAM-dependent methyltransferase [Candidatus Micrarchaeota archaeon]
MKADVIKRLKKLGFSQEKRTLALVHNFLPVRFIFWKRIEQAAELASGEVAVDFGCGGGPLLLLLSDRFDVVHGVDIDIGLTKKVKDEFELHNVNLVQGDISKAQFEPGSVDAAYFMDVLEHIKEKELIYEILENTRRFLKPSGKLIVSGPTENFVYALMRKIYGHKKPEDHYWDIFQLEEMIRDSFQVENELLLPLNYISSISLFKLILATPKK